MATNSPSFPRHSSVKALLSGLFDYAGMFPPASLALEQAIARYMAHRAQSDAWMLGAFVVSVNKLDKVLGFSDLMSEESPVSFNVLPRPADSMDVFEVTLQEDLSRCTRFMARGAGKVWINALEFRFPPDALLTAERAVESTRRISTIIQNGDFGGIATFGELQLSEQFEEELPLYFLALASVSRVGGRMFGKIRCGGTQKSHYPTPSQLASFLHTAIKVGHAFKATAGLHHAVRHFNRYQNVSMHGFLNLFFAATLGRVNSLDRVIIQAILEEERAESFEFTPTGIRWNSFEASTADFIHDRKTLGLSIGSCSFDDPREDLLKLGWLTN